MARNAFIFLTFILLSSCSEPKNSPIKIAINPWTGYKFLYLAEQLNLYKQVNLNIEIIQVSTLADVQRTYLNGQVDGFFRPIALMQKKTINMNNF
jgi:NitT/TauT family transport system substrate-binding protein